MRNIDHNAPEGTHPPMSDSTTSRRRAPLTLAGMAVAALVLTACRAGGGGEAGAASPSAGEATSPAVEKEVSSLTPRAVVAYDGGLLTVDTDSGEVVSTTEHDGFLRLNNAGDGKHVMVSDSDVFRVFDGGLEAQAHGDHYHYYESAPQLSDITFDAPHAGHVVLHNGKTTLFGDGDGSIQVFESEALKDGGKPETRNAKTENPHHGVALELADGTLFTTQGTENERHTAQVLNEDGPVKAETTDCPGVHGEAAAAPGNVTDTVMVGCENGPVVYRDGTFHKVAVPDGYARSGNLAGVESSPIVLGDYKVDENAEPERPTRVALFDTRDDSHQLVELGSSYWFRSLARGPEGEGLVLTYDGKLNVIDEETGEVTRKIDVIEPWREKEDWQAAGPAVKVAGSNAYVTDAEHQKLHVVDLEKGEVTKSIDLPETPVEMAVITGKPEAPAPEDGSSGSPAANEHSHGEDHGGHGH